jgi:hypothetical protein
MAHYVLVEDSQGELIDLEVYCSDSCAQTSPAYAGWYGAQEVEFNTLCAGEFCETVILGACGEFC